MRKALLSIVAVILTLSAAVAGWLAWRVWSQRDGSRPVLMLRVNRKIDVKILQGNPLVFTVYMSGSNSTPTLRIGSPGHPWHSHLRLESAETNQPLPWRLVPLGSPQSFSYGRDAPGQVSLDKDAGDEAVVDADRIYSLEFGIDPKEAATIPDGRYTARALLDIPWWPPWRWSGRIVSKPVTITVVRQGDTGAPAGDLERLRLIESVRFYLGVGKFQDAYDLALQIKEREPEKIYSYLLLGDALNGLKRYQEALAAYDYALHLSASEHTYEPPTYLLMRRHEVEEKLSLQR